MEIFAVNMRPDIIKKPNTQVMSNNFGQTDNQQVQQQNQGLPENKEKVQVSKEKIDKAIDQANESLAEHNIRLEYSIHEKTKEIMVKVMDENTGEVIREIPSQKALDRLAMVLKEIGSLVDEKV